MLIDTHIWIWWMSGDSRLKPEYIAAIAAAQNTGIGVSVISCWEVAKLVEVSKLTLTLPVFDWIKTALSHPGVHLIPLTPEIAVESTQLPGGFHKDPADQILVATARVMHMTLLTADEKILAYPHVSLVV